MTAESLHTVELELLGTPSRIAVERGPRMHDAVAAALRAVADVDDTCSRFRDDSELAALNARAGEPTRVSPLLAGVIEHALRAARLTGGALDPTVGRAVNDLGYGVDFRRIDGSNATGASARPASGWAHVHLDRPRRTVHVPHGTLLDLDVVAKAIAVDRATRAARTMSRAAVLVEIGGDLAVAGTPGESPWVIRVSGDAAATQESQLIGITQGGVATSGTSERRWRWGGHDVHHLVDPRTGLPAAERYTAVSIAAGSCLDANIAAAAAIILGGAAPSWLTSVALPARLVAIDGDVTAMNGWPA